MVKDLLKRSYKYVILWFVIFSIVLLGGLLNSSSANAQSIYDDVINISDGVYIHGLGDNNDESIDVTTTWLNLLTHSEFIPNSVLQYADKYQGQQCDFNPQIATSWLVRQNNEGGYTLVYTNDENVQPLHFYNWAGMGVLQAPPSHYRCTLNYINNETIYTSADYRSANTDLLYGPPQEEQYSLVFANWDIDYPQDYQGVIPPDSIEPPQAPIGVSIRGSVAEDIVHVEWYNDPENPAPDEAKGLYLVLHNTNYDEIPPECSNDDIQEWRHSIDKVAIFNPVPCYGLWKVQSYYTSDTAGQDIIPNTDKTTLMLRIDGGSFYFDYIDVEYDDDGYITSPPISGVSMADCVIFTEDPPWVEFEFSGCFDNVQAFIGIAKENNIQVSRQFDAITLPAHSSCGSFSQIDDFLHIDPKDNWVCPQLTDGLRTPVTYFAVFLLYIITIFGWFKFMSGRT